MASATQLSITFAFDKGRGERAELLERLLQNPRLPSPPTLALQIFQKTGQEDCSIKEISDLLAHDPGLSAKILKTLNSAFFGRARPVTNVWQAVTMLGNRPLRALVLGLAMPIMQAGMERDGGLRRFWKKSVAGAVMARELAALRKFPAPDDDLAASLLRDVGKILLRQTFPEKYRPIWLGETEVLAEDLCRWEEENLGINHAEAGAALLDRWKLPIDIVEPIRYHHQPERLPPLIQPLVDRAFLLDFVCRLTDLEEKISPRAMQGILQTAQQRYGLDREGLEQLLNKVGPKIEEFSIILGVDIGECPGFDELLVTGCEELVKVSVEAARANNPLQISGPQEPSAASAHVITDFLFNLEEVPAGTRIMQYEVEEVLGRGAMGVVLKGYDPGLARHVAIKVPAPELANSQKARNRFALEARFAAALRHEHVTAIYAVHELEGIPFLVMEYVKGSSLDKLIEDGKRFSVAEIARIGRQTALGLAAAHAARLIHRDIKPGNILLEDGTLHVRIVDFGLARAIDEDFHLSQPGMLLGTPNFMSPEQVDGITLTAASDLFSLGSVLYYLCTGILPFQADTLSGLLRAVAEKNPIPIQVRNPGIPKGLAQVIEQLHAKNPADRPPSAAVVADLLQPWCQER